MSIQEYLNGNIESGKLSLEEIATPEQLRQWIKIPKSVRIELTNHCNAKCKFCAHGLMNRPMDYMSDEVFDKIVSDISSWYNKPKEIKLSGHGDFTVDPKWKDRLSKLNEIGSNITLETNGIALTEEELDFIISLSHVKLITFNIPAVTKERYKDIVGVDHYDEICHKVQYAITKITTEKRTIGITVSMVTSAKYMTTREGNVFKRMWGQIGANTLLFNYAGKMWERGTSHKAYSCQSLNEMNILYDGSIPICWLDIEGITSIGNIMENNLDELWNSEELEKIREMHNNGRRDEISLCNKCDFC